MHPDHSKLINNYRAGVAGAIVSLQVDKVGDILDAIAEVRDREGRIYIIGNGGSAATATHFASDLCKGAVNAAHPRIKAFALIENTALSTAWANDTAYENIFAEQISNHVVEGDLVIAISCSGNSPNILKGITAARGKGAKTIAFTGYDGGKVKDLADIALVISGVNMEQAEDIHLMLCHIITTCLRSGR
jgi:D-sedoheptulose 7-phosphate isomerase